MQTYETITGNSLRAIRRVLTYTIVVFPQALIDRLFLIPKAAFLVPFRGVGF